MSQIPEAFMRDYTEEQEQAIKTWILANPNCTTHELTAFMKSV